MKLKGATVLESLVAMVILVITLGAAIMMYSRISDSDAQRAQYRAMLTLEKIAADVIVNKRYLDAELNDRDMHINIKFTPLKSETELYEFVILASNQDGKLLAQRKELIFITE